MHIAESPSISWIQSFRGSNFAPAFFFLSTERRQALKILYAVFRVLDDAVDKPQVNPNRIVSCWREFLETGSHRALVSVHQEDLGSALLLVSKTYDIPLFLMLDFIKFGISIDLEGRKFETPMDFESYCYGVAGTVGVACLPIFGVPWQEAKDYAVRLGTTVQWINAIRDVGVDAKMGRLYLPLDHLEKFGCDQSEIFAGRSNEHFLKLMRYEAEIARSHYRRAQELLPRKWHKELLPARIMGEIYMKLLAKIEKHDYPVLTEKIRLSYLEKGIATWKAVRS